jgi:beta-xylosidase
MRWLILIGKCRVLGIARYHFRHLRSGTAMFIRRLGLLQLTFLVLGAASQSGAEVVLPASGQMPPGIWTPDQGDGSYVNPVLNGDYSDPDVIRVGQDYFLTASSFTNVPGLPILHSRDLVNWTIIGHALPRLLPLAHYSTPRHGGGVWAPALRFHNGTFYIYFPDPDFGIFVVTAKNAAGPWAAPELVDPASGAIDPCPFWDDDGQAWLVHAWAASRAGFANIISLKKLSADGMSIVGMRQDIIKADVLPRASTSTGPKPWYTTEGPKLYKRDGWYYIFAPADGVKGGFQGVFRSRSITGRYEGRNVLDQGSTAINGPHQGAWVSTPGGEDWFLHFQDTDSYGRRVWLEPMTWKDGWPLIGAQQGRSSYGQPVLRHRKPGGSENSAMAVPIVNDDFAHGFHAGWQWNANPQDDWADVSARPGYLRLKSISSSANLWEAGNLLTQKLPGQAFTVTVKMRLSARSQGERAGLVVYGYNYGWIGLQNTAAGVRLVRATRLNANEGGAEQEVFADGPATSEVYLRVHLEPVTVAGPTPDFADYWPAMLRSTHAQTAFSYSFDGVHFTPLGAAMTTLPGRWVGTQIGLFAQAPGGTPSYVSTRVGWADFASFEVTP